MAQFVDADPIVPYEGKYSSIVKGANNPLSGVKNDQTKPRTDLLSTAALLGVAEVLGFGAKKYAAHNWRGGIEYSRLIGAAMRHLLAINDGEDLDPESGLPHVDHLGCCVMFLSEQMKKGTGLDDRYKPDRA